MPLTSGTRLGPYEIVAPLGASGRQHLGPRPPWVDLCRTGQADRARAVYEELQARSRHDFVSRAWLFISAGSAGLEEQSNRWAERAVAERDPLVLQERNVQFWDIVRVHPRFNEIMHGVCE
jgi:hypothetical protein